MCVHTGDTVSMGAVAFCTSWISVKGKPAQNSPLGLPTLAWTICGHVEAANEKAEIWEEEGAQQKYDAI